MKKMVSFRAGRSDFFVICLALLMQVWLWHTLYGQDMAHPQMVEVFAGKQLVASYDLGMLDHQDVHLDVGGPLGASMIEMNAQGARFVQSPCQNKQCVQQGWMRAGDAPHICLPNRMMLRFSVSEWDGIAQ